MKRGSTIFLRSVVIFIGLLALALCVYGLPRIIGTFSLSGYDPILLGMYVMAIPFFIALHQALKLFGHIENNKAFSNPSVIALKNIKLSATIVGVLLSAGMPYIFYVADKDDAPGVVLIALIIIFASVVTAVVTAVVEKLLKNAIDIKSENDLTV